MHVEHDRMKHSYFICWRADPIDVRKPELLTANSAIGAFSVRRKLTFKLPLWFNKQRNDSWRNPL